MPLPKQVNNFCCKKQLYSQVAVRVSLKQRGRTHYRAESGFIDKCAKDTVDIQSLGVGGGIENRHVDKCRCTVLKAWVYLDDRDKRRWAG